MSIELPALFDRIERGLAGGFRFEQLMHHLLHSEAAQCSFKYEPGPGVKDGGVDGWLRGNYENLRGDTALQYKFVVSLFDDKGQVRSDLVDSIRTAHAKFPSRFSAYAIVAPCSLRDGDEAKVLDALTAATGGSIGFRITIWPVTKVEYLLTRDRLMLNYFYPDKVRQYYPAGLSFDVVSAIAGYKEEIAASFSAMNLAGSARAQLSRQKANKPPSLRDLYVPLRLGHDNYATAKLEALLVLKGPQIVQGVPGSGKTTFGKYLSLLICGSVQFDQAALESARQIRVQNEARAMQVDKELTEDDVTRLVPLYVPIRRFVNYWKRSEAGTISSNREPFIGFLAWDATRRSMTSQEAPDLFETILLTSRGFVIFDGLDEASELATRQRIVEAAFAFIRRYPGNRFVFTSRPAGLAELRMPSSPEVQHWHVMPFNEAERQQFVDRWYAYFIDDPVERESYVHSLKRALVSNTGVAQLAETPILITMMALLHMGSSHLPEDRGQLYSQCVDLLLHDWEMHHKREASDLDDSQEIPSPLQVLGITVHEARTFLARIAFEGMQNRRRDDASFPPTTNVRISTSVKRRMRENLLRSVAVIQEHDLEAMLFSLKYRPDREYDSEATVRERVKKFIRYIRDRAGLLYDETGSGDYVFAHLSLQEYLAAYHISINDRLKTPEGEITRHDFVIRMFKQPAWRESLLLLLYEMQKVKNVEGFPDEVLKMIEPRDLIVLQFVVRAMRDRIKFSKVSDRQTVVLACDLHEAAASSGVADILTFLAAQAGVGEELSKTFVHRVETRQDVKGALAAISGLQVIGRSDLADVTRNPLFVTEPEQLFPVLSAGRIFDFVVGQTRRSGWGRLLVAQPRHVRDAILLKVRDPQYAEAAAGLCAFELALLLDRERAAARVQIEEASVLKMTCQGDFWELQMPIRRCERVDGFSVTGKVVFPEGLRPSPYFADERPNPLIGIGLERWFRPLVGARKSLRDILERGEEFARSIHERLPQRISERLSRISPRNVLLHLGSQPSNNLPSVITRDVGKAFRGEMTRAAYSLSKRVWTDGELRASVTLIVDPNTRRSVRMTSKVFSGILCGVVYAVVDNLARHSAVPDKTPEELSEDIAARWRRQSFEQALAALMFSEIAQHVLGDEWLLATDLEKATVLFYAAGACSVYHLPLAGSFWRQFEDHIAYKITQPGAEPILRAAYHSYRLSARTHGAETGAGLVQSITELAQSPDWKPVLELFEIVSNGSIVVRSGSSTSADVVVSGALAKNSVDSTA
ncbi:NACHT domain-containing protein [Opitutus terrae]|uniref:NTPase (NACHT family)-like protein n=1 Tax=Opitutus terrae (strain DSM 11246 / JCM 15787 / PB90-1) TaxID=452637 RepID=B1ZQG9_OPITP|nr:NACHT family-like NTPase [Opitutus terrae]ACB75578.1 NTPase (NACHT family)-like protein [Opitutus terrae PB90-1]